MAEPGWNERLVYTFGGGCNVGYHQGLGSGGVLNDLFLSRGYAVASSSLNVYDNNCSEVISAEVALMVKEHFAETYGVPRYTIGWGGSGGAIQQHLIGNNYPGILDGMHTEGLALPKSNWAQKLDRGPFVCYPVTGGITFTFGGLKITPSAQVLDTGWRPIEGLYCCGEMVGNIFHHDYPGGTGLVSGAVFGRIAGASAARAARA